MFFPHASSIRRQRTLSRSAGCFLETTWRMSSRAAALRCGVGQYSLWSAHFSAPELLAHYVRENAHNYFAQIAGELGAIGLIAFVAVLLSAVWGSARRFDTPPAIFPPAPRRPRSFCSHVARRPPASRAGSGISLLARTGNHAGHAACRRPNRGLLAHDRPLSVCRPSQFQSRPVSPVRAKRIDFTRITYGLADGCHGRSGADSSSPTAARTSEFRFACATRHLMLPSRLTSSSTINCLRPSRWETPDGNIPLSALQRQGRGAAHKIDLRTREHEEEPRVEVGKWDIISTPDA